jgi:hypothetical protein
MVMVDFWCQKPGKIHSWHRKIDRWRGSSLGHDALVLQPDQWVPGMARDPRCHGCSDFGQSTKGAFFEHVFFLKINLWSCIVIFYSKIVHIMVKSW